MPIGVAATFVGAVETAPQAALLRQRDRKVKPTQLSFVPVGEGFRFRGHAIQRWVGSSPDVLLRRNRLDALRVFPLLAGEAAAGTGSAAKAIGRTIDDGLPLVDAVSEELGVGKASVRSIRELDPGTAGSYWEENPISLLKALDRMPANRRPRSMVDWRSLRLLHHGIVEAVDDRLARRQRSALRQHLFDGLAGLDRRKVETRLQVTLDEEALWRQLRGFVRTMEVWIHSMAIDHGYNCYVAAQAEARLTTEWLTLRPAREVLKMAREWDGYIGTLLANDIAGPLPSWPALLRDPVVCDGCVVASLTEQAALKAEGEALEHCAGGYAVRCAMGRTHLVSIRDGNGTPLSTAEIRIWFHADGPEVQVIQHRGRSNSDPPRRAKLALEAAICSLLDPLARNYLGHQLGVHREWQQTIAAEISLVFEMSAWDGIAACMTASVNDCEGVIDWISNRLADEEGCYRHRNDQAGQRLRDAGVEDISGEEYHERGFFDTALYSAFEDFEAELWGKDWWRTSLAETWRTRTFLDFLQWMYVE